MLVLESIDNVWGLSVSIVDVESHDMTRIRFVLYCHLSGIRSSIPVRSLSVSIVVQA